MTKEGVNRWWQEVCALCDGKAIEERMVHSDGTLSTWVARDNPCFYATGHEYRVKPEPREWWLGLHCGDVRILDRRLSQAYPGEEVVHVKEVVEP